MTLELMPSLMRLSLDVSQYINSNGEPASERLIQAVAQTLNISRDDIQLFDSFAELGGDAASAEALRQACRRKGIDVNTSDVLECPTLAELQTRIKPFPPRIPIDSMNSTGSSEESNPSSNADDDLFTPKHRKWADSISSYGSVSTTSEACAPARPVGSNLESLLKSFPRVSNVCLVMPKAGPFDGQLVAFIRITNSPEVEKADDTRQISLPPRPEIEPQKREIRSLRMAVQEWGADSRRPQIWIPLSYMPVTKNKEPDSRRLQTWAQNINEVTYEEVMKIQIPEPRRRPRSPNSRQRRIQSWAESRKSIYVDDAGELDDMACFPLSPMQQLHFQTMKQSDGSTSISHPESRFIQSVMLKVNGSAESTEIEAAVEAVVARHDMLRARFRPVVEDWVQVIMPQAPNSYRFTRHTDADDEEIRALVEEAEAAINPTEGPVFAVEYIHNEGEQMLYLTAHHLVVDAISWRIMVHDLDELLQKGTLLSEGSISFPHWIDYQNYEMSQRLFEPTLPFEVFSADLEYWGLNQESNTYGNTLRSSFYLTSELSSILQQSSADVLRTEPADVLLASLLLAFCQTFTDRSQLPTLWKQEHGRDAVDADFNIMETVGWFTSLCPIGVILDSTTDLIQVIKLMKDTRRAIPRDGIPFFTSEFSSSENAATSIPVEIIFNCMDTVKQLQRTNGLLEPVAVPGQQRACVKSDMGPDVGRIALFEVSVMIDDSGAQIDFVYNKSSRHREKIATWTQAFEHNVLEAIGRLRVHEPELTLSDAPLLRSSYKALSKLTSERLAGSQIPNVRDIETIYPVTPAQQEILIAQTQNLDTFHVHAVYELNARNGGPIDTARLCNAWEAIVVNKPALRSIFIDGVSREGLFDQVILKKTSPNMLFIESSNPDEAVTSLPALGMPLTEPRHRLSVCHNPSRTIVRVDASQAICDLTSLHRLLAELSRVYSGEAPLHNEALHCTYLYHVSSMDTSYSLEVWKTGLSNSRPCLFPHLSVFAKGFFQSQPFDFDISETQLRAFCQEQQVEASAVFQLAWALVLRAFVGMEQVTFGYQFSGRDEELLCGINQAVGSFASILPCWVEVPSNQPLKACLRAVGESFANARKHENLTMAEIQHALGLADDGFFNTCVYFQDSDPFGNDEIDSIDDAELIPSLITSGRKTECDLSVTAMFIKGNLHANLSSRYLSHNQMQSVMSSFEAALKRIIEHPFTLVTEADLYTDRDYAQLVVHDWESTQRSQKISACVHDIILQHSLSRPEASAICSWDGDISYIQLTTLVTRLRTYLVNLGVGPGMTVPVVLEKNRWAPVMLLAVMQAGASFVALDCQDQITVRSTIDYLKPHIVLASEVAWRDLGTMVLNLVIVNNAFFAMLPPTMSSLTREASPEHAACVFVTPKRTSSGASRSIFFTHSSLCTVFASQGSALKINSESRVLQLSAFNVDVSLVEILGTMFQGGCVCIPSAAERVHDLPGAMARMGVTWSYMTGILARRIHPATVPFLKTLCFRTRKLDPDTYAPWLENRNILLAYGAPDVCPLGISITEVSKDKELSVIPPPVSGRFWILNPEDPRKLMPVGAIGELAIDSPLVTPHRFDLDKPLIAPTMHFKEGEKPKPRYLKTGHRVRLLDDGNIQFLSSIRDEVTVNGMAVDVAEVELQIRRCLGEGVDVVVDSIMTRDTGPLLAAFLELGPALFDGQEGFNNVSPTVKERTYIAKKLFEAYVENPEPHQPRLSPHCIPVVFIPLKELPVSTSLKVNRRKLQRMVGELAFSDLAAMSTVPNPAEIQRIALAQKPLPLTRPEEAMRALWSRILHVPASDIKGSSSFLSAGGNKFLATELVIACRKLCLRVSLTDVLNEASLTEICRVAEASHKSKKGQDNAGKSHIAFSMKNFDAKLVKEAILPQLQCSVQDVLDVAEASSQQIRSLELGMFKTRADIVCMVLKFNGPMDGPKLEDACDTLTRMHPALRTAFVMHEHKVYQVHLGSFKAPFRSFPCEHDKLDSVTEKLVRQEQNMAFDPKVPVTQFTFLDAEHHGTLIIRLSKTQIDNASGHLVVQDLASLYEGSAHMTPRSSFLDYTRASQQNREQGLDFWTYQLDGAKMTKVIANTKPTAPAAMSEIKSVQQTVSLGPLMQHSLGQDSALKAAWAIVLATISGIDDILFGEVIQTHHVPLPDTIDLGSMIGPLTNVIPVRVQFPSRHSTPLDLMTNIQRQRQSNSRHEMFGIQELVSKCTKWRACTQFSTVVQHEIKSPFDGSSTLNISGATFTYKAVEPEAQWFPDLLVRSTLEGTDRVTLEIKYSEERLTSSFVQSCLSLLVAAWETLTHPDTIHQPMIQSCDEIARAEKQVPFPPKETSALRVPLDALLQPTQKKDLEFVIANAWDEVIKPSTSNISEDKHHTTPFYSITKSLLPAHTLTSKLNQGLEGLEIRGLEAIHLKVEDVLAHPSMQAQLELIARLLRIAGTLALPVLRKGPSVKSESGFTWRPRTRSGPKPEKLKLKPEHAAKLERPEKPERSLTWRNSILLKPRSSMRELGVKAGGWMKHKKGDGTRPSTATSEMMVSALPEHPILESPLQETSIPEGSIPSISLPDSHISSSPTPVLAELEGTIISSEDPAGRSSSGGSSQQSMEVLEVSPIVPFEQLEKPRSIWGAVLDLPRSLSPLGRGSTK
ncbi:non-ribosomal peptide synthetase [Fusarium albosuccineum]|uniref:Non-ribosomal peptide synthetase n=1 Tax=Fusarium albosuccineum TaxID=1237068 RepID=A0A8H4P8Q8_9HYPO|nr:non-ribosomal peptide synthetase [Fusarium albosuccineum]